MFSLVSSFWLLAAALFIVGLGLGSIEVGGNSLIVELHSRARGRFLNLLAVFHGVGSFLAPLFAAQLLTGGFSWRQVYQFSILLAVGLLIFFVVVRYPQRSVPASQGVALGSFLAAGFSRRMSWYYLLVGVYVAAELGIAAWIVEYLQQVKGFSLTDASLYLSLFFAAIMIGRLAGSFIVERVGYLRALLTAAVGGLVCLSIGVFASPEMAVFIPLTGLFFSIIFPTTTASVSALYGENMSAILGVLFAFGGLGGALGPWAIGVTADAVGLQWGFALTIVFCLVMLVALLVLQRMMGGRR
jgi:fucose permease